MKGDKSTSKADNKLGVNKSAYQLKKKKNATKDPNKPKRPTTPFFVFMEDFREEYKEKYPENKSVVFVGKAGGDKWKHLTDAEKAPYIATAEKRKVEYEKLMHAYNRKLDGEIVEDEEHDKAKSEVDEEKKNYKAGETVKDEEPDLAKSEIDKEGENYKEEKNDE